MFVVALWSRGRVSPVTPKWRSSPPHCFVWCISVAVPIDDFIVGVVKGNLAKIMTAVLRWSHVESSYLRVAVIGSAIIHRLQDLGIILGVSSVLIGRRVKLSSPSLITKYSLITVQWLE